MSRVHMLMFLSLTVLLATWLKGLGCMGMSFGIGIGIPEDDAVRLIGEALDLGCNFFDILIFLNRTFSAAAEIYGPHTNESIVGKAMKKYGREKFFVATKCGFKIEPVTLRPLGVDGSYENIKRATPIEESMRAMKELVEEGKIKYVGLSEASATTIRSFSPIGHGFLSGEFRRLEDLPPSGRTVPRFNNPANFAHNLQLVDLVAELAKEKGCTPAQLALAWVLSKGKDIFPIPGTTKLNRLAENFQAADVVLTLEDLTKIETILKEFEIKGDRYNEIGMKMASGHVGQYIVAELLKTGKHTITALTRTDSPSSLPGGVAVARVDYNNHASLVAALRGQEILIITLSAVAPPDTQTKLVDAAIEAGVQWVLPNEWGIDGTEPGFLEDIPVFQRIVDFRRWLDTKNISYISAVTGFWYEWSLAMPDAFGFNIQQKSATLFDDGNVKMTISTWPQVGRYVAALLSLPVSDPNPSVPTLERYKNSAVYVSSFTINQNDMLDSLLRVTGSARSDWTITTEASKDRFLAGAEAMKKGDYMGFVKVLYSRAFYPDGSGEFEYRKGTVNAALGLPKEDLDEATKAAVARAIELQGRPF
ncbi:hypothetical protein HDU93_001600 [Gonapodya sp. JEL0774]|nr:hypothetical protein HDU93_001600 [Gonapodya sp. JEL0774]